MVNAVIKQLTMGGPCSARPVTNIIDVETFKKASLAVTRASIAVSEKGVQVLEQARLGILNVDMMKNITTRLGEASMELSKKSVQILEQERQWRVVWIAILILMTLIAVAGWYVHTQTYRKTIRLEEILRRQREDCKRACAENQQSRTECKAMIEKVSSNSTDSYDAVCKEIRLLKDMKTSENIHFTAEINALHNTIKMLECRVPPDLNARLDRLDGGK